MKERNQSGIEVVELALTLPLVIFLILGTFDLSRIVTGYSAVRAATILGTRQAAGRERDEFAAVGTAMTAMGGTINVGPTSLGAFTSNPALTSPAVAASFTAATLPYLFSCPENGSAQPLTQMFRYEVRALTNANYLLNSSFPSAVFPCPPGSPRECFTCCVLRGNNTEFINLFSVLTEHATRVWAPHFVGIKCDVRVPLLTAGMSVGFLSRYTSIAASSYAPVSNYNGEDYNAQE